MLNRVPYLDSNPVDAIMSSLPPSVQYAGRDERMQEEVHVVSRYRLVAAAITAIFIASACSGATPSSAPASVRAGPFGHGRRASPSASAAGQDFTGVTVELLTFNGPQIAEPLQRRAPDFEALTGAKINVVAVGFQEIYDKAILDLSTGTNSFDAFVFNPQWLGTSPDRATSRTSRRASRAIRSSTGRMSVRSSATSTRRTGEGLHHPARRRLPHGLLPKRPSTRRRRRGTNT